MIKVITAFSAKGGTGVSVLTANLAIYLAQKGRKVLLIDAAPNGGSLHSYMNIPSYAVTQNIPEHFSVLPLLSTDYQNLKFFSNLRSKGSTYEVSGYLQKWETEIQKSDFDFIFIDLGSAISEDLFTVMNLADFNLLYTNADPISMEKTNFLMRQLFNHQLHLIADKYDLHHVVQNIQRKRAEYLFTPRNLLLMITETVPKLHRQISEIFFSSQTGLIFNNVRNATESEVKDIYPHIINSYFGFELVNIGEVSFSEVFANAVANLMPVVTNERSGELLEVLGNIASRLSSVLTQIGGDHG